MLNKENLRALHIEESVIKHLSNIVRNNPDPRSLITKEINPLIPISPIVAAHIRDKKTKRALIRMCIYNMMCLGYEDKKWAFAVQFTSGQYEVVTVGRNETDTSILFNDAILLGIVRAIKERNKKLDDIVKNVETIENEISYDDISVSVIPENRITQEDLVNLNDDQITKLPVIDIVPQINLDNKESELHIDEASIPIVKAEIPEIRIGSGLRRNFL